MTFLAFGANYISSWIRIHADPDPKLWPEIAIHPSERLLYSK
jgi:hypothetical protein